MNMSNIPLLRAAALAAALVTLSAAGFAGGSPNPSEDRALQIMSRAGYVQLARVSDVRVGSSIRSAFDAFGPANRILSDGTWLVYKDFHVDQSSAHGTLVVSFKDGRVSGLRLVSPNVAVALVAHPGSSIESVVVALNR